MPTEKDGSEPPSPAAPETADSEITNVKSAAAESAEVEVLDEDLLQADTPDAPRSALELAVDEAKADLSDGGHTRLIALYERELEAVGRGEVDKQRTALYQH